ncbi:MAG: BUG/TctC family periplasmic protein, partial [uncultured Ramlibacter sp.]
ETHPQAAAGRLAGCFFLRRRCPGVAGPADCAGGSLRRRRPHRRGGPHDLDPDGQVARADRHRGERGRRGRHHRRDQGGPCAAQRLHHLPAPHGHVDGARPVQEAAVRSAEGLRVHRPGGRRADDAAGPQGLPGQQLPGVAGPSQARGQQGLAGQRGPGRGVAPVRAAVHEPSRGGTHHGAVLGHRSRDERPAGQPGRPAVRPDHPDRAADQGRPGQGVRRHGAQAPGRAAQRAHARRARPEGFRGQGLARHVRAQGHAAAGDREAQYRPARGHAGPGGEEAPDRPELGCRPHGQDHAGRPAHAPGGGDHQVGARDPQGRRLRRL